MKVIALIAFLGLSACNNNRQKSTALQPTAKTVITPKPQTSKPKVDTTSVETAAPKVYANTHFKDVTATNLADNKYLITGKAQIFEANFGWVIEDGHKELQKGNTMTGAGAPEWGNFSFTINAKKERENSTLHIILFEASAKNGSRQYELPVPLY